MKRIVSLGLFGILLVFSQQADDNNQIDNTNQVQIDMIQEFEDIKQNIKTELENVREKFYKSKNVKKIFSQRIDKLIGWIDKAEKSQNALRDKYIDKSINLLNRIFKMYKFPNSSIKILKPNEDKLKALKSKK